MNIQGGPVWAAVPPAGTRAGTSQRDVPTIEGGVRTRPRRFADWFMASQMPSEVRVEAVRDDVAYQFPVRPLGKLRLVGVIPAVFGVLFVSVPLRIFLTMLHGIAARNSGANANSLFQYFFLAFTIPFFVVGSIPIAFGLAILFGRCRVEWREKRLSTVEQVGPFRWRRRLMASKGSVHKLIVSVGPDRSNGTSVTTNLPANLAALSAEFDSGKPRIAAMGYPREWLQAVAEDLSKRVGAVTAVSSQPKIETIFQGRVLDQTGQEMVERPLNATVRLEATANGISMSVPPAGLWKGSKGMLGFSIFWCGWRRRFANPVPCRGYCGCSCQCFGRLDWAC